MFAQAAPDSATSAETNAASRVAVVFVGRMGEHSELSELLRELLVRQGVACEFSEAGHFDADELFAEGDVEVAVRVFVRLADAKRARLYFRGPGGERFLLRTIALPSGLDEVGRELIGQVVESSVVTLLRSSSGLSREQASAEVARETSPPAPSPPRSAPALKPRKEQPAPAFAWSAALRYAAESFGPDLGPAHGPGLELGARTIGDFVVRGRLSAERFFVQSLGARELTADVQTNGLRGGVDAGFGIAAGHVVSLGVGGGIDVVELEPRASRLPGVTLAEPRTNVVPVVRPELRYELGVDTLLFAAAVFADISLLRTHYDLDQDSGRTRLGTPWLVRPGSVVLLGLRH